MSRPEPSEIVISCPNNGSGCFKDEPELLGAMLYMDDAVVRTEWENIGGASHDTAANSLPIEEMTFKRVTLEGPNWNARLVEGEDAGVEQLKANASDTGLRIAHCGYACGKAAVGSCPVFVPIGER